MGTINNVMWPCLYYLDMLKLIQLSSWLHTTIMKSISAAQHSFVVSLLNESYSHHQIQSRTGLEKSTIGRISKTVEESKEDDPACDKQTIIGQISLESLIMKFKLHNSLIPSSLILSFCHSLNHQKCIKKIKILLCNKEESFYTQAHSSSVAAQVCPVSWKPWRTWRGCYGQMEGGVCGNYKKNHYQTKLQYQLSNIEG